MFAVNYEIFELRSGVSNLKSYRITGLVQQQNHWSTVSEPVLNSTPVYYDLPVHGHSQDYGSVCDL